MKNPTEQLFRCQTNLYALTFIVLADLSEPQRERLTSTLTLRGYTVQMYTFEVVREVFLELFCMPKSSLDNPSLRTGGGQRAFCILDQGEVAGEYGYWAEDDETGEEGFLPEMEDVFWTFQDDNWTWSPSYFQGRKIRRGKGKGKGKGRKGRTQFTPFRKGKTGKGKTSTQTK